MECRDDQLVEVPLFTGVGWGCPNCGGKVELVPSIDHADKPLLGPAVCGTTCSITPSDFWEHLEADLKKLGLANGNTSNVSVDIGAAIITFDQDDWAEVARLIADELAQSLREVVRRSL
ncbi:MAG: hypothetical protein M3R24_37515 [Chloroflexota bacterium]|nr:hypothetical protein [Chloroflexota bacterium]